MRIDTVSARGPTSRPRSVPRFAQLQLALGAAGITCQKLGEAEVRADADVSDGCRLNGSHPPGREM